MKRVVVGRESGENGRGRRVVSYGLFTWESRVCHDGLVFVPVSNFQMVNHVIVMHARSQQCDAQAQTVLKIQILAF